MVVHFYFFKAMFCCIAAAAHKIMRGAKVLGAFGPLYLYRPPREVKDSFSIYVNIIITQRPA
jgi:hypothetical protein